MDKATSKLLSRKRKAETLNREFYSLRSLLGYDWAISYFLIGGRAAGKSYATTDFFCKQWRKYGRPFYWIRLSETSRDKLLANNADKLIDPDIRRKYQLDLVTSADRVYEVTKRDAQGKIKEKKLMATVLALATFYNDKGSGFFDKDFLNDPDMYYNICIDEMNREKNEKKTFDIVYAFTNELENIVRSTKQCMRVICIGHQLEEASDILCAFNFLAEEFGRYKLKSKRAVIEYIEPSEKYLNRRKGTIADILMPEASTFTNQIKIDDSLVSKKALLRPDYIIKFGKEKDRMFTIWNGNIIAPYNNEKCMTIAMAPYLDEVYNLERKNNIFTLFNTRNFKFRNLITFKRFQKEMSLLKPR